MKGRAYRGGSSFLVIRFQSVTELLKEPKVKLDFNENRICRLRFCLSFWQPCFVPRFKIATKKKKFFSCFILSQHLYEKKKKLGLRWICCLHASTNEQGGNGIK